MIEITLKTNGKKYDLPLSADEIKNLIDNGVKKACDFEIELKNRFDEYLPVDADLELLNKIAMDITTLQKQDKVEWLIAMLDAYELNEIKISNAEKINNIDSILEQNVNADTREEYVVQEVELEYLTKYEQNKD